MKKINLLLCSLMLLSLNAFALDLDKMLSNVETIKGTYAVAGGLAFEKIENPDKSSENLTDSCLQLLRTTQTNWWAYIDIPVTAFETVTETFIEMKVKCAAQSDLVLRVNGTSTPDFRPVIKYSTLGDWQTIKIDISAFGAGKSVNNIRLMVDCGFENSPVGKVLSATDFMYIDEIKVAGTSVAIPASVDSTFYTFETAALDCSTSFGATAEKVQNPTKTGLNTSDFCVKLGNIQTHDYELVDFPATFLVPESDCYLHIMAKSTVSPNIVFRTMPDNGTDIAPIDSLVPNDEWQDLVFNIGEKQSAGYSVANFRFLLDYYGANLNNSDSVLFVDDMLISASATPRTNTVTELSNNQEILVSLYPNPVVNTLFISGAEVSNATIYNIAGQQVLSNSVVNNMINVSQLTHGMYIVSGSDARGNVVLNQQIVKQ